jgi:hypothetical protein
VKRMINQRKDLPDWGIKIVSGEVNISWKKLLTFCKKLIIYYHDEWRTAIYWSNQKVFW